MGAILTKHVNEFVDDLKDISAEVFFMSGFSTELMKVVKKVDYQGDILDVSVQIWGELRLFSYKMQEFDSDLKSGININIAGLEPPDPRLPAVRARIYGYLQQFSNRNDARLS